MLYLFYRSPTDPYLFGLITELGKRYIGPLIADERTCLHGFISKGKAARFQAAYQERLRSGDEISDRWLLPGSQEPDLGHRLPESPPEDGFVRVFAPEGSQRIAALIHKTLKKNRREPPTGPVVPSPPSPIFPSLPFNGCEKRLACSRIGRSTSSCPTILSL